MTMKKAVLKLKKELELFDDELEKYEYIINLGKKLTTIEDEDKIAKNIVHGCTSQVWLICKEEDNKLIFSGTSDAIIVKGLIYIILQIFSNRTKDEIQDSDLDILYDLSLSEIVTPNRQSGVIGMIKKIKKYALE